jgi:hypothetical protein
MSRKYASTFAQNAKNVSGYSSTRQEFSKIGLRGAGAATGQRKFLSPSGKESTEKKHRRGDCCIRREYLAGVKRRGTTTLTN